MSAWAQQAVVQPLPGEGPPSLSAALLRLGRDPRDISALIDAGNAALAMGDTDAAIGFFTRADKLSPNNAAIEAGLAGARVRAEDPFSAIPLFESAERNGPISPDLLADRGLAYDLVADNGSAQKFYRQAIAAGAGPEATRRLALSLAISGDRRGVDATLAPLLEKQDRAAWRTRAFALAILGREDEAVSVVRASMPGELATGIAPYLRYMRQLTPAQQAAAANLGHFPRAAEIGHDDPRIAGFAPPVRVAAADAGLVPAGQPLGTLRKDKSRAARPREDGAGELAPAAADARRPARASVPAPAAAELPPVAPSPSVTTSAAPPTVLRPAPTPPARAATPPPSASTPTPQASTPPPASTVRPAPTPVYSGAFAANAYSLPPKPPAPGEARDRSPSPAPVAPSPVVSSPVVPPPVSTSPVVATPPSSTAAPAPQPAPVNSAATAVAALPRPSVPADRPAPTASAPVRQPARVTFADAFAGLASGPVAVAPRAGAVDIRKITPARPAPPPPPPNPSRIWVQVGVGRAESRLEYDWRKLQKEEPELFRARKAWMSDWGRTNRLLIGPFETEKAADSFMSKLRKAGHDDAFVWTSPAGQVVDAL